MSNQQEYRWSLISATVRGAAHERAGLPNQDAVEGEPQHGSSPWVILAISDGHGSPQYFRSNVGSRLAVQVAIEEGRKFIPKTGKLPSELSLIKSEAQERLPREIVERWRSKVMEHLSEYPFTEEELQHLEDIAGSNKRARVVANKFMAYGATLLLVLIGHDFIVYLQLGDGDILVVSKNGEVSRVPLQTDERLIANETTSLCMPYAQREFRVYFQTISNVSAPPAVILASTDGYSNSFSSDKDFLKVGSDILEMIRSDSLKSVNEHLEEWLSETSQKGSGDDITLGIIYRIS